MDKLRLPPNVWRTGSHRVALRDCLGQWQEVAEPARDAPQGTRCVAASCLVHRYGSRMPWYWTRAPWICTSTHIRALGWRIPSPAGLPPARRRPALPCPPFLPCQAWLEQPPFQQRQRCQQPQDRAPMRREGPRWITTGPDEARGIPMGRQDGRCPRIVMKACGFPSSPGYCQREFRHYALWLRRAHGHGAASPVRLAPMLLGKARRSALGRERNTALCRACHTALCRLRP